MHEERLCWGEQEAHLEPAGRRAGTPAGTASQDQWKCRLAQRSLICCRFTPSSPAVLAVLLAAACQLQPRASMPAQPDQPHEAGQFTSHSPGGRPLQCWAQSSYAQPPWGQPLFERWQTAAPQGPRSCSSKREGQGRRPGRSGLGWGTGRALQVSGRQSRPRRSNKRLPWQASACLGLPLCWAGCRRAEARRAMNAPARAALPSHVPAGVNGLYLFPRGRFPRGQLRHLLGAGRQVGEQAQPGQQ